MGRLSLRCLMGRFISPSSSSASLPPSLELRLIRLAIPPLIVGAIGSSIDDDERCSPWTPNWDRTGYSGAGICACELDVDEVDEVCRCRGLAGDWVGIDLERVSVLSRATGAGGGDELGGGGAGRRMALTVKSLVSRV